MPNMQMCVNGHYYDGNRFPQCPYCKPGTNPNPGPGPNPNPGETVGINNNFNPPVQKGDPANLNNSNVNNGGDDGKTVAFDQLPTGIRPAVGWLVCVGGPETGKDYTLHAGNNFVGRAENMDVVLRKDNKVSRDRHFVVFFDPKHDSFRASMAFGQEMVYLNDEPLTMAAAPLKRGDIIEVGDTKLLFVPLCGPDFRWEEEK